MIYSMDTPMNNLVNLFTQIKIYTPTDIQLLRAELEKIKDLEYMINDMLTRPITQVTKNKILELQILLHKWNEEERVQNEQQRDDIFDYYQTD